MMITLRNQLIPRWILWSLLAPIFSFLLLSNGPDSAGILHWRGPRVPKSFVSPLPSQAQSFSRFIQMDRLSPILFKKMADWYYGFERVPSKDEPFLRRLTLAKTPFVKQRSLIFVDSSALAHFQRIILPKLSQPFVLLTGDTDLGVPQEALGSHKAQAMLNDPRILHWYAMNCDLSLDQQASEPKFSCLMNGISQWNGQLKDMQAAYERDIGLKYGLFEQQMDESKEASNKWIFSSFRISNNPTERQALHDMVCSATDSSLSAITTCFYNETMSGLELYKVVAQHRFVLSPRGRGADCYRTYEALYLGSFPIVRTSSLDSLFADLPVLIVKDWSELTQELLQQTYRVFTAQENRDKFKFEKLYPAYWMSRFYSHFDEK